MAVSDFSWPATCNVVEDLGAIPLFVDVDKDTYNMSSKDLSKRINSGVKAVIFVDALGNPSGIDRIKEITTSYGIPLIQDSACGIGSASSECKVGAISDFTCYSFHPRKLVTTGEGGAILTNNDVYAEWLGIKLACGMTRDVSGDIEFVDFGYNYRLSELQALMGRIQLKKLDEITESRNDVAREYTNGLEPMGFRSQRVSPEAYHNKQSVVLTVPTGINRDTLIDCLRARGIESTLGTYCLSNTTYYRKKYKDVQKNALWLQQNTITLPCYEGVDVGTVIGCIMDFVSDV